MRRQLLYLRLICRARSALAISECRQCVGQRRTAAARPDVEGAEVTLRGPMCGPGSVTLGSRSPSVMGSHRPTRFAGVVNRDRRAVETSFTSRDRFPIRSASHREKPSWSATERRSPRSRRSRRLPLSVISRDRRTAPATTNTSRRRFTRSQFWTVARDDTGRVSVTRQAARRRAAIRRSTDASDAALNRSSRRSRRTSAISR